MDFVTPGFLAAGLAAAIPILIHLLFRRRARRIDLGTIRFLQLAMRDQADRRRVRRWLLLATRIAAVLLLALLFARPFLRGSDSQSPEGEWLLAIDQSASTSARGGGATRFAQAQDRAATLLRNVPEGTTVRVGYFDDAGVVATEKGRLDFQRQPTARGTDYAVPLKWARDLLWRSRQGERRLIVFTDLQKAGLRQTSLPEFPRDVDVEIVDVGRAVARNLGITAAAVPLTEFRQGHPTIVLAEVRNTGTFPARDVPMTLELSGAGQRLQVRRTVTVTAGSREQVRFEVPISHAAVYEGRLQLPAGDELAFDDTRYLAFETRFADKVLLLNGQPAATPFAAETYFLEMALRLKPPESTAEPVTPFDPQTVVFQSGSLPDFQPFSTVILANAPALSGGDVTHLSNYVRAGGRLVVFGGSEIDVESYQVAATKGLLPARVLRIGDLQVTRVQSWDKSHPLLGNLSDPQHGDLRSLSFRKVVELESLPQSTILIRDQFQRPLLLEGRLGKGQVLMFAMAADRDWGDWPTHRLYVPLIHQTLRYATGRLSAMAAVKSIEGADRPGITRSGDQWVVRNPDPRESDVSRVTEQAFRRAYKLPIAGSGQAGPKVSQLTRPADSTRASEIGEWTAWILLAVLIVETFVANRTHD